MRSNKIGGESRGLLDLKVTEILWTLTVAMLLFQPALQHYFPVISWFDEAITVLMSVCAFATLQKKPVLSGATKAGLLALALFVAMCLLGNITSGVPGSAWPILIDAFTCVKFFIAVISARVIFSDRKQLFVAATVLSKFLVLLIGLCAVLSLVVNIGMSYSEARYGLYPFEFVFPHPTYLAVAMAGLIVLLSAEAEINAGWIVFASITMALTLRGKAMGFAALVLTALLLSRRGKRRIGALQIALMAGVALIVGWGQIEMYFGTDGQARTELLNASLQVASVNLPIGTGFASFGSAITADPEWYSPLYLQYGLSSVWGLSREYSAFISDSFWPTVIGQSGLLGLLFYCTSLSLLLREMFQSSTSRLPVFLFTAYLLIMSTSESAFFSPSSIYLVCCVSIASYVQGGKSRTPHEIRQVCGEGIQ